MTLREVTDTASIIINKRIDAVIASKIVWECMVNLTALYSSACKISNTNISCTDSSTYYELPDNCGIIKVMFENKDYKGYEYNELGIRFLDIGEYKIYYYDATIPNIEEGTELSINKRYHMEIAKYLAFSILQIQDPSSRLADKLLEEFFINTKEIDKSLNKIKKLSSIIPSRIWR
jgi:hypothetical protein